RDFFIGTTSVQGSVYHAGILFLNGAGFWVRVRNINMAVSLRAWFLSSVLWIVFCIRHLSVSVIGAMIGITQSGCWFGIFSD
ncbi:hypothetical protein BJ925_0369, partial [Rahnella aquatilis]